MTFMSGQRFKCISAALPGLLTHANRRVKTFNNVSCPKHSLSVGRTAGQILGASNCSLISDSKTLALAGLLSAHLRGTSTPKEAFSFGVSVCCFAASTVVRRLNRFIETYKVLLEGAS